MAEIAEEWYASWFDSPYYPILYQNRNDQEAREFIDRLLDVLAPKKGVDMLDMACGRGRHSVYLSSKGYKVHGIDLSEESIRHANQFACQNLSFAVHDIREVYQENAFDLIFNLFTSFGYFSDQSDNIRVLEAAMKGLRKGGYFVLDFMNSPVIIDQMIAHESKVLGGISFDIKKRLEDETIVKTIEFSDKGRDFSFEERVTAFPRQTLEEMVSNRGMSITHRFGSYQLDPYSETESERLILIATPV